MKLLFPTKNCSILCQGITSAAGAIHTEMSKAYGSQIVAGVSRDKGLTSFLGIPVFQTVKAAVRQTKPKMSVVFSTSQRAYADVEEAIKARIPIVVCTTEHVPFHDVLKMKALAEKYGVQLLGPSSQGIVAVDHYVAGTMPAHLIPKGHIGIVSRSSSLIYEAVQQLSSREMGISMCVALGAAPILGTSFVPVVESLLPDPKTKAILIIGKYNGLFEFELASYLKRKKPQKPILAYIPGRSIRPSHARCFLGADFLDPLQLIQKKETALKESGVLVIPTIDLIGPTLQEILKKTTK